MAGPPVLEDGPCSYYAFGPGDWFYYGVHAVEMLVTAESARPVSVRRLSIGRRDVALVRFANDATAVVEVTRDEGVHEHRLEIRGRHDTQVHRIDPADYDAIFAAELRAAIEMAATRELPVVPRDTLTVIGILELGDRSLRQGGADLPWPWPSEATRERASGAGH